MRRRTIVLASGFPIARAVARLVVIPPRVPAVVAAPLVYLPPVVSAAPLVAASARSAYFPRQRAVVKRRRMGRLQFRTRSPRKRIASLGARTSPARFRRNHPRERRSANRGFLRPYRLPRDLSTCFSIIWTDTAWRRCAVLANSLSDQTKLTVYMRA